jgi:hypothetical protein
MERELAEEKEPPPIDVDKIKGENFNEMRRYAILSQVAYDVYNRDKAVAEKAMREYLPKHDLDEIYTDTDSAVITKDRQDGKKDVIISYRGTQDARDVADWEETILPDERFKQAQQKFDLVKTKYPDANITTTGHSLGGGLAHYVGKNNNVKSFIFNAAPSGLQDVENTPENASTLYRHPDDPVSSIKIVSEIFTNKNDKIVEYSNVPLIEDILKRAGKFAVSTAVGMGLGAGAVALGASPVGAAIGVSALGAAASAASGTDIKQAVLEGIGGYKFPIFTEITKANLGFHSHNNFLPLPDEKIDYDGYLYPEDYHYDTIRNSLIEFNQKTKVSKRGNLTNLSVKTPILIDRDILLKKCTKNPKQGICKKFNF